MTDIPVCPEADTETALGTGKGTKLKMDGECPHEPHAQKKVHVLEKMRQQLSQTR